MIDKTNKILKNPFAIFHPYKVKELLVAIYDDIQTIKASVENLNTKYNAHLADTTSHTAADTTNTITNTNISTKLQKE